MQHAEGTTAEYFLGSYSDGRNTLHCAVLQAVHTLHRVTLAVGRCAYDVMAAVCNVDDRVEVRDRPYSRWILGGAAVDEVPVPNPM